MKTWCLAIAVGALSLFPLAILANGNQVEAAETGEQVLARRTLVIGKVTTNPKKLYRYLKPIVDYAANQMKDLGITGGTVLMAGNNRTMIRYLKEGRVDWLTETPYSSVLFAEKAGAEILLKKWKKGVSDYHTIFFSRKDSGINSLDDLKGKTIAFEDLGSTSAYYEPAAVLLEKGMRLVQLNSTREQVPASAVGYLFSGREITSSTWVYKGIVDAGALNNLDWNKADHMRRSHRKSFTIFHQNRPVLRALELVRKDLDPAIRQRLQEVLLSAHKDPGAQAVLDAYQKTTRFEELDREDLAALDEVKKRLKLVDRELK